MVLRSRARGTMLAISGFWLFVCPTASAEEPRPAPSQPSFLLIVLDTVRADAVSAYGKVDGTTPSFDQLASEGVRYERVFAPAPWTLPSHATLFTGRRVDEHRVAMPGQPGLSLEFETLAEALQQAGYETAAFSENAIVSDLFGLLRGFDHKEATTLNENNEEQSIDAATSFVDWIAKRDSTRPFFAFVNILDAHRPYTVRSENPWVPKEASEWAVSDRPMAPERQICGALPTPLQIAILRGLYLGDVRAADRKLGRIVEAARASSRERPLITVVTSDHGELFGEDMLLGHDFSLHSGLLAIPLVVNGVAENAGVGEENAVVVSTPVGLEDLMPSMLGWAHVPAPEGLVGVPLPLSPEPPRDPQPRTFFSAYSDQFVAVPEEWRDRVQQADKDRLRQFCADSNRVFGGMTAMIRYPFKYVWYERYPASLFDLSWDPSEQSDQAPYRREVMESMESATKPLREASGVVGGSGPGLSKEAIDALKRLGYVQ